MTAPAARGAGHAGGDAAGPGHAAAHARVLPYGQDAVLVELADPTGVSSLARAAAADADVVEAVPGARTVLLRAVAGRLESVRGRIDALLAPSGAAVAEPQAPVELEVVYDGADLAATARELGIDADELITLHTATQHLVAFCGFAPGFAYLSGIDQRLRVRRHAEPRTRVPAGSVAIAGEYTGVYPRASPGGWRLLGRTEATLWDAGRDAPALLVPGTPVRFRAR